MAIRAPRVVLGIARPVNGGYLPFVTKLASLPNGFAAVGHDLGRLQTAVLLRMKLPCDPGVRGLEVVFPFEHLPHPANLTARVMLSAVYGPDLPGMPLLAPPPGPVRTAGRDVVG